MEKLVNCNIIVDIELVEKISGGNQTFDIIFIRKDKSRWVLKFDYVWDMRYSIENGCIARLTDIERAAEKHSGLLLVEDSEYLKYFEYQVLGTLPMNGVKNYILLDEVDTVIEILTLNDPILERID